MPSEFDDDEIELVSGDGGSKGGASRSSGSKGSALAAGRIPLFLNSCLERYGFMKGTRVTDIVEYKIISKAEVMKDLEEQKESSELYAIKDKLEEYEGDSLLFIRGPQNEYDYNYLWCSTVDSYDDGMSEIKDKQKSDENDESSKLGSGDYEGLGGDDEEEWPDKGKRRHGKDGGGEEKASVKRTEVELTPIEIATYHVKNHRPRIGFTITQPRFRFCKATEFDDVEPGEKPAEYPRQKIPNYTETRQVLEMGFQAASEKKDSSTQTFKMNSVNKTTQYASVNWSEEEKENIMSSDAMKEFMKSVSGIMLKELSKNETLDPFQDEFSLLLDDDFALGNRSENTLEVFHSFHHLKYSKNRSINGIQWHSNKALVAFSCSNNVTFDQWVEHSGKVMSSSILMYLLADLLHPYLVLEVPGNIQCFKCHPTHPEYVAGGLATGQVIFWDLTDARQRVQQYQQQQLANQNTQKNAQQKKQGQGQDSQQPQADQPEDIAIPTIKYTILSYIDRSHSRPVSDIVWMPAHQQVNRRGDYANADKGISTQFATVAADGKVLFWDFKNKNDNRQQAQAAAAAAASASSNPATSLAAKAAAAAAEDPDAKEPKWAPVYICQLLKPENQGFISATKLSVGEGSTLMVVSEDGEVVELDLAARATEEKARPETVKSIQKAHFQACGSIERSPHFPDIYLTVGDWTFSIWKVGVPFPVFTSSCSTDYLSCGRWSPTRPGIIITARADGTIDVWDLVDQCHKSSLNFQTGFADGICSLEFWQSKSNSQQYLGCGDNGGKCHIIEIPRNLRRKVPNEDNIMKLFYEREIARQAYCRKRNEGKKPNTDSQSNASKKVSIVAPGDESGGGAAASSNVNPATGAPAQPKEEKITEQQLKEKAEKQKALEEEKAEKDYQRLLEQFKTQLSGSDL